MEVQDVRIIEEVESFRKKKNKPNVILAIVFIILTIGAFAGLIVLINNPRAIDLEDLSNAVVRVLDENFTTSTYSSNYLYKLNGTIRNNTDNDFSYVKITYSFYNSSGEEVTVETAQISDLNENSAMGFSISFYSSINEEKITSYKLKEIAVPGGTFMSAPLIVVIVVMMFTAFGVVYFSIRAATKDSNSENKIFNTILNTELKARNFDEDSEKIFVNKFRTINTNQNQNAVPIFIVDRVNERICFINYDSNYLVFKPIDDIKSYIITINGKIFTKDKRKEWINEVNKTVGTFVKQLCLEIKLNNFNGGSILYDFSSASKNIIEPLDEALKILDEFTSEEKAVQKKKTWRCPYCKTLNSEDSNKCSSCGSRRNE